MRKNSLKVHRGQAFLLSRISRTIFLCVSLSACAGKGGGAGGNTPTTPNTAKITCNTLAGTYIESVSGSVLVVSNTCTFTDSYCGYDASYTLPTTVHDGDTTIVVNGTNGAPGCMSSTPHACVIGTRGDQLGINCDSQAYVYLFTKQ